MKRIIGCGNLLLKDEGIGVHLIEYLKLKDLPEDIELVDGATAGFDLLPFFQDAQKIVIVDAIRAEGPPGSVYKFTPDDFSIDTALKASLHDITLDEVFKIAAKLGKLPPITIFGVQPKDITWGMELSQDLKKLLPELGDLVIEEIKNA
jgi:hydrogenase maturation protease